MTIHDALGDLTDISANFYLPVPTYEIKHPESFMSIQTGSVAVLAEIPRRSPRKIFIYIIKKYICRVKVPEK